MAGNHRRQLARTCKRFGLLVQPNALPLLIRELEARGGAESEEFLVFLGVLRDRLTRAPSPKLVSLSLVEQVLEDERGASARQQQPQQKHIKTQRTKVVLRDEDKGETGESRRQSQQRHEFKDEYSSFSSPSSLPLSLSNRRSHHRRSMATPTPTPVPTKPWRIVSAFDTPKLVYDSTRRQFRYDPPSEASSSLMGTARDLVETRLQRYELVKQKVDRHREKHNLSRVTTIDRLLGTATATTTATTTTTTRGSKINRQRTLLGMLRSNPSLGCLELEDPTGSLPLAIHMDRSASSTGNGSGTKVDPRGLYLEGSMVLVTGTHEESLLNSSLNSNSDSDSKSVSLSTSRESLAGTVFRCASIELPPPEPKAETVLHLPPHPHTHTQGNADASARHRSTPVPLYALSNLALDEPECLERVSTLIDRMIYETSGDDDDDNYNDDNYNDEDDGVAAILVLFGNFCTEGLTVSGALDELATLLRRKTIPSKHSVLLVPGPGDVGSNACWPLPAWNKRNTPSSLHPFLAAPEGHHHQNHHGSNRNGGSGGGGIVHLCSNPCRLEFSDGRTVLLLRKDLVRESLKHQVLEADDFACLDGSPSSSSLSPCYPLAHRVVHHAMSQSHLSPASSSASAPAPIYWNFDHAMALLPIPELILAGLDAEYLEEGVDVNVDVNADTNRAAVAGCRFVAPISNPSRNEWQCALAVLGTSRAGKSRIHVEFENDEDYDENDNDMQEEATLPGKNDSQDIYEKYRALGGTQTDTQFSQTQTQLSAC